MTIPELQIACRERGMRAIGISKDGLRQRLQVRRLMQIWETDEDHKILIATIRN